MFLSLNISSSNCTPSSRPMAEFVRQNAIFRGLFTEKIHGTGDFGSFFSGAAGRILDAGAAAAGEKDRISDFGLFCADPAGRRDTGRIVKEVFE